MLSLSFIPVSLVEISKVGASGAVVSNLTSVISSSSSPKVLLSFCVSTEGSVKEGSSMVSAWSKRVPWKVLAVEADSSSPAAAASIISVNVP